MNPGPYPPRGNNPQPPYNPNYYQPPPYGNMPPKVGSGQPQPQPHRYSGWLLAALVIGYITAMVLEFMEIAVTSTPDTTGGTTTASPGILGFVGGSLLIIINVIIMVVDSRSFFTLYGKLQWRRMKTWLKIVLFFAYFGLCVMPAIYLVMATRYFLRVRRQRLGDALRDGWLWYSSKTQKAQLILGMCFVFLLVFSVTGISLAAIADRAATLALLTPTAAPTQASLTNNAPTSTPTLVSLAASTTPTLAPTATPRPTPKPTPKPKPTPTPKPSCNAVNGNPWCFNFDPGNLIYYPPSNFCDYFNCIASFWGSDDPGDGYVVQCSDGTFSQSGGERGACSYHGGVNRPLYSH